MKVKELEAPFWFDQDIPGATTGRIRQFEDEAGVSLPDEYRQALMLRDGGVSTYSSYQYGESYFPLPPFFSIQELHEAHKNRRKFDIPKGVIVIASSGHGWLGLDFRDGGQRSCFRRARRSLFRSLRRLSNCYWMD